MPTIREKYLTAKMLRDVAQKRLDECLAQDPDAKLPTTQQSKALLAHEDDEVSKLKSQMDMGFSDLRVKQEGAQYILILTADNESETPQQLSWEIEVPAALHRTGRIQGNELLRPRDRNSTRVLLSKSLAELQGYEAGAAMSKPIKGAITLGSNTVAVNTTWSKLSKSTT